MDTLASDQTSTGRLRPSAEEACLDVQNIALEGIEGAPVQSARKPQSPLHASSP